MSEYKDDLGCQGIWAETILKGTLWCDVHDRAVADWDGCRNDITALCSIRALGITTEDDDCPSCEGTGEMVTDWKPENGVGWTKARCVVCGGSGVNTALGITTKDTE